jgi:hypothetical protein
MEKSEARLDAPYGLTCKSRRNAHLSNLNPTPPFLPQKLPVHLTTIADFHDMDAYCDLYLRKDKNGDSDLFMVKLKKNNNHADGFGQKEKSIAG